MADSMSIAPISSMEISMIRGQQPRFLLIAISCLWLGTKAIASEFKSPNYPVTLIELFSSEGCSSCPPAEQELGELLKHKDLWKKFVPINFHVDYWNHLGWADPYSNATFSERQRHYAAQWGATTIYTPAFVINGQNLGTTIGRQELSTHSRGSKKIPQINLKITSTSKSKYLISVECRDLPPEGRFEIHMALLGNGLISKITAGENKGEKLIQNFTVLSYKFLPLGKKGEPIKWEFDLSQSKAKPISQAVAAWIVNADTMIPLQAVGGPLK